MNHVRTGMLVAALTAPFMAVGFIPPARRA